MLSRFFQLLPHCSNLEYIQLWENCLTKNDLEQVIHMDRLQKPITMELNKDVIRQHSSVVIDLLRSHPEMRLELFYPYEENRLELYLICDLNWYGRYLLDRKGGAPLSLWPLVFEKANSKPSIIYEFLKGPAFGGRDASV